jgi:Ricin-type beta-trefoil lectin domain
MSTHFFFKLFSTFLVASMLISGATLAALNLVSTPKADAATTLTFTNKPSDTTNYSVCVFKKGSAQSGAVKAESFSIPTIVNTNGDVYVAYTNNSSSCFPLVNATPTASSEFVLVNGHQTEVALANYGAAVAAVASSALYNEIPTLLNVTTPKGTYTGSTATLCQGNTGAVKVTFDDTNMNELVGTVSAGGSNFQGTPVFDTSVKGKVTITVYPTTAAVANTAGFTATFTGSDVFVPTASVPAPTVTVAPAVFTKEIRFSVVPDCTVAAVSSVVASSSLVSTISSGASTVVTGGGPTSSATLVINNKPSNIANFSTCVYANGSPQSYAIKAENFVFPNNIPPSGLVYSLYINNSDLCFPLINPTPVGFSEFMLVKGHTTTVELRNYNSLNPAIYTSYLSNQSPVFTSIVGPVGTIHNGNNFTLCQGNASPIYVTFDDPDLDRLNSNVSASNVAINNSIDGKLVFTFVPTLSDVSSTANTFTKIFDVSDSTNYNSTQPYTNYYSFYLDKIFSFNLKNCSATPNKISLLGNPNLVLDNENNTNMASFKIKQSSNTFTQNHSYDQISNQIKVNSSKCMDIGNYWDKTSRTSRTWDCHNNNWQKFKYDSQNRIRLLSDVFLCLEAVNNVDGSIVDSRPCNNSSNQKWDVSGVFMPVDSTLPEVNPNSKLSLVDNPNIIAQYSFPISYYSQNNELNVFPNPNDSKQYFRYSSGNLVTSNNLCVEKITTYELYTNNLLKLASCQNINSQKFNLDTQGRIHNLADNTLCLEALTQLILYEVGLRPCNDSSNQKWNGQNIGMVPQNIVNTSKTGRIKVLGNPSLVLDPGNNLTGNFFQYKLQNSNSSLTQYWKYDTNNRFGNNANKCMDIGEYWNQSNRTARTWDCHNDLWQKFKYDTSNRIRLMADISLCLESVGEVGGSIIDSRPCSDSANQKWDVSELGMVAENIPLLDENKITLLGNPNMALDSGTSNSGNLSKFSLKQKSSTISQSIRYDTVTNQITNNNKCMDIGEYWNPSNRTARTWGCHQYNWQKFKYDNQNRIRSVADTALCLESIGETAGSIVDLRPCSEYSSQKWDVSKINMPIDTSLPVIPKNGRITLLSDPSKSLDAGNASGAWLSQFTIELPNNSPTQLLEYNSTTRNIKSLSNNSCMDIGEYWNPSKRTARTWGCHQYNWQKYQYDSQNRIHSVADTALCLEAVNNSIGSIVDLRPCNTTSNQKWDVSGIGMPTSL